MKEKSNLFKAEGKFCFAEASEPETARKACRGRRPFRGRARKGLKVFLTTLSSAIYFRTERIQSRNAS
jgi:hypothetical protein